MAVALGNVKFNVKRFGSSCEVPENPKAKLMYYLHCICATLDMDSSETQNLRRLRDFDNYQGLSDDEETELLLLCAMLSPDILVNKIIFQDSDMCKDSTNAFYELTAIQNRMVVSDSIMIGGQTRRVSKIMAFEPIWLRDNYIEPMKTLAGELQARQRRRQRDNRSDECCIM